MIWQEFMFACAMYPTDSSFLENVEKEVLYQVKRLNHHASIVLWGGSNENEAALNWYGQTKENRDRYVVDFTELYVNTIYKSIRELETYTDTTGRPFVDTSPSNGVISLDPYTKVWGDPFNETVGDTHHYDFESDCEDYETIPDSRFMSEFGFQSMPSFESFSKISVSSDWGMSSDLVLYRQRGYDYSMMESLMKKHFIVPPSREKIDKKLFDQFIFISQVQQGRCYEESISKHRRSKHTSSKTMGTLYWQLNDVWQGIDHIKKD